MSSILRRVALMALIMSTTVTVSMAAPYEAPKAVSTPSLDTSVLQGYSGDVNSVGVSFTINTDGSVSSVQLLNTTGNDGVDAAVLETVLKWKFTPATDSNGNPVASSKTEYINFRN